ncbi:hypothetical protein L6452_04211 [Arctium lappa]|uniref:Uncharacterized protein n=1 Tax=Arctium lappa TaxID=4217 RepID=A0ACB9FPE9_ARCLA|nr:hypothetical protein L6452_04211 [Arctium lappa]
MSSCQRKSPLCVIADDSIFLTIALAHLFKTSRIMSSFPVEIIQEGVICCQAPFCLPGKVVAVGITSGNQEAYSEISEFENRDKPNSYGHTNLVEKESHRRL